MFISLSKKIKGLVLLVLLGLAPVAAEEEVAFLVEYKGEVKVLEQGKIPQRLSQQMPLFEGDKVITRKNGYATILLEDKSVVELHPYSSLTIKTLSREKTTIRHAFFVDAGKLIFSVFKRKNKQTSISTPSAIAGIKSTELALAVEKDDTYVGVLEGEVEVTQRNTQEKVKLFKDQEAEVSKTGRVRRHKLLKLLWAKRRLPKFRKKVKGLLKAHPALLKKLKKWRKEKIRNRWKHLRRIREKLKERRKRIKNRQRNHRRHKKQRGR